jgi:alcohol dehydrogenase
MRSFQHLTPPLRLFQGPIGLGTASKELERLNSKRAVIFCGASLARDVGLLDLVRSSLGHRCAGVFTGVRAHSPLPSVETAAAELKSLEADAVIAVGGGSAIVTARAATILAAETGDARSLCTTQDDKGALRSPKLLAPKLPQFVIPTTPTTAIVKAGSAVFDPVDGKRLALFDPKTRAHSVFIDPQMLHSAPRHLVTSSSLNTLASAIEGLMSRSGNPLADASLMHSVRLLARHLSALATCDDPEVRSELVLAAILCGQGTDHAGAGVTTVLGHAIGARHGIENGMINAIVLPHVLRFNAQDAATGLAKVATALGNSSAAPDFHLSTILNTVQTISGALGISHRLRDVGVPFTSLPRIAEDAMGDWFLRGNPRQVRAAAELEEILEQAW